MYEKYRIVVILLDKSEIAKETQMQPQFKDLLFWVRQNQQFKEVTLGFVENLSGTDFRDKRIKREKAVEIHQ